MTAEEIQKEIDETFIDNFSLKNRIEHLMDCYASVVNEMHYKSRVADSNKAYHLAELKKTSHKDILDNYKQIADHTSYDYVKGAQYLLNTLITNASK